MWPLWRVMATAAHSLFAPQHDAIPRVGNEPTTEHGITKFQKMR